MSTGTARIVIFGGGGFVGQALCAELLKRGNVSGQRIESILLADISPPEAVADARVRTCKADITQDEDCDRVVRGATHVVHFAGVMSGTGEKDFDLCMRINLDGTRKIIDGCRRTGLVPKFLFASTNAVFGITDTVEPTDQTKVVPLNTYGVTKACCELIVNDATRRGFIDGRCVRLPTVIVRPGKPNAATTSCFSGVIREPLAGMKHVMRVEPTIRHPVTSTRCVVASVIAALCADGSEIGFDRAMNLPARTATLQELVAALHSVVEPADLVKLGPVVPGIDQRISATVAGMKAQRFGFERAKRLGVPEPPSLEAIIREYVMDYGNSSTVCVRLRPNPKL